MERRAGSPSHREVETDCGVLVGARTLGADGGIRPGFSGLMKAED